ncbi:AbrB/MazE/SpoVT family DNA-binding domain-containing protein [Halonotius sp. GCM10025705]|uniref:AbrB/MazE/SpoVT family DNA-binding domain-containing protein n=1 Tax=Halonotius sp. GCM10025705 TaxID=3252678 RepID=UPI0036096B7A
MGTTADERGRIYLPKDVRDRYGDRYRIVELPTHVVLLPVDDDPIEGLRDAVGDAFADIDHDDIEGEAITTATAEIDAEIDDRERRASEK